MQPHPNVEPGWPPGAHSAELLQPPPPPVHTSGKPARVLLVLWPAFMVAALLEALVFVVVDPASLHGLHGQAPAPLGWSAPAVYTLSFFLFWALVAMAAAVTLWLDTPDPQQGGDAADATRQGRP
jgi:hypothetical protein